MVMMKHINGGGGGGGGGGGDGVANNGAGGDNLLRPQGSIQKSRKPVKLFLQRLKQYLLYSKLRSLIPSPSQQQQPFAPNHQLGEMHEEEEAIEMEIKFHEIPFAYTSDSDNHENNTNFGNGSNYDLMLETKQDDEDEEEDGSCTTTVIYESDDEDGGICKTTIVFESNGNEDDEQPAFVPSVTVERMDDTILINTVVLKDKALTSSLFKILEDENCDIVFENQYRTERKVCHTIQVRLVQPKNAGENQCNVDRLEKKLQIWANGEAESML